MAPLMVLSCKSLRMSNGLNGTRSLRLKFVREWDVVEENPWVPEAPVEAFFELLDASDGVPELRIAHEHE